MATFDWPASLSVQSADWRIRKAGVQWTSPYSGSMQAAEFLGERWVMSITLPPRRSADAGAAEAFFARLAGGVHRVRAHHFFRPVPLGTMRGAPTLGASVMRGAQSVVLNVPTGQTLRAGDMIGIAGQLLQCAEDCASTGNLLTVPLVNRVRAGITSGAAVTWDRPTALFALPSMEVGGLHQPSLLDALAHDLMEVW